MPKSIFPNELTGENLHRLSLPNSGEHHARRDKWSGTLGTIPTFNHWE